MDVLPLLWRELHIRGRDPGFLAVAVGFGTGGKRESKAEEDGAEDKLIKSLVGEAVKAVVELNPGKSVTAEELIALCKDKLGSVKAPKSVEFTPALPRSTAGKVLKKDLRAQYWTAAQRKI